MTKSEFMESLSKALDAVAFLQKQEILADFEEHFSVGLSEGKTEEEISTQLGDPQQIARQFVLECRIEKAMEEPVTKNIFRAVFASVGLGFFNLVFILGPFIGVCAVLFSLFIAVFAIGLAGIVSITVVIASPVLGDIAYLGEGLDWLVVVLCSIGLTSLSILLVSPMLKLTKWFYKQTIKYLKFNMDIITNRRNRT